MVACTCVVAGRSEENVAFMHDQNTARHSGRQEENRDPEPKPISFYATDGAIPLNFIPLPEAYDPDGPSTAGDLTVDRALERVSGWIRRPQHVVARWMTPAVNLFRRSEKHTTAARDI